MAVTYTYTPYGAVQAHTTPGSNGSIFYQYNALLYRGYYYDADLGMYYLQSRFYDPVVCRFINEDELIISSVFMGYNLYSYCYNNPVSLVDYDGNMADDPFNNSGNVGRPMSAGKPTGHKNSHNKASTNSSLAGSNLSSSHSLTSQVISGALTGTSGGTVNFSTGMSVGTGFGGTSSANLAIDSNLHAIAYRANGFGAGTPDIGFSAAISVLSCNSVEKVYGDSYTLGGSIGLIGVDIILFADSDGNIYGGVTVSFGLSLFPELHAYRVVMNESSCITLH